VDNSNDKASPGQPFRAPRSETWNGMVDAGNAYRAGRLNVGAPPPTRPRQTDLVRIKNNSGADRARGEILLIDGKAITDLTDEHIWLLGDEPTADGYFAILKEPIASGGVGVSQVSGCCLAMVDVSDTDHTRAKAAAGLYMLESSADGPLEILYQPGTTGEVECVVRFASIGGGGGELYRFELAANFSSGTTVAATIKTMGGSTVGTGISLTDPEAIFLGLPTGSKGYCVLQGGTYYAIQAACAAEEGYV
jgi:hypothetical protein